MTSAPTTNNARRYLDVREAAQAVRLTEAHFYKRRTTPKFSLEFRCNNRRSLVQRMTLPSQIHRRLLHRNIADWMRVSRARSASGRLVGLHAGEDRCRQATRGTVEKRVQHKIGLGQGLGTFSSFERQSRRVHAVTKTKVSP